jgi:RNA ligase (TIGR02306 family)
MSTFEVKARTLTIEPHPNADRIEIARVDGFQSIVQKGAFQTGDVAVYIPEQAIVPEEILADMGLWDTEKDKGGLAGKNGQRVKAVKLRQVLSQGLIYSPEGMELWEGQDYAQRLGIEKYVPEVPVEMSGKVYAAPVTTYTDIENLKRYPNVFEPDETVVATEKIHGTCCVFHYDAEQDRLHVSSKGLASKGLALEPDQNNLYWRIAEEYQIQDKLLWLCHEATETSLTLYGEGIGVQDLMYGHTKGQPGFRAFDLLRSDGSFVDVIAFQALMQALAIPCVPSLVISTFKDVAQHTDGKETLTGDELHVREGIVIKPIQERTHPELGRVVLKSISEEYLLRNGATEYE